MKKMLNYKSQNKKSSLLKRLDFNMYGVIEIAIKLLKHAHHLLIQLYP